jgi:hypothetical protein
MNNVTLEEAESKFNKYNRAFKITCVFVIFLFIVQISIDKKSEQNFGVFWPLITLGLYYYYKSETYKIRHHYLNEINKIKSGKKSTSPMLQGLKLSELNPVEKYQLAEKLLSEKKKLEAFLASN